MSFRGKKIILTGGTSGIGKRLLQEFTALGAIVFFCGKEAELVREQINFTGQQGICVDLAKEDELQLFFEKAIAHLNTVDILINNAGYVIVAPFTALQRSDFEAMFAINAIAPARLSQLVLPCFHKQGFGDIVNVGATGAYYPFEEGTAYAASKSALQLISKNISLEQRKNEIRVFHIDPSWCTDTNNNNRGTAIPRDESKLVPEDIAQSILQLLQMDRRAFVPQMSIWGTKP